MRRHFHARTALGRVQRRSQRIITRRRKGEGAEAQQVTSTGEEKANGSKPLKGAEKIEGGQSGQGKAKEGG